jgi:ring-1,2-phenylacetyl-CoA epoxidase subunit PaaA
VISHAINELYGAQVFDEPAIAYAPNALRQVADLPRRHGGVRPSRALQAARHADRHPRERMIPGSGKRPLSIFEFPLKTWEEFVAIKLLADLAEILQVEDLCTAPSIRSGTSPAPTMPEERFHAQFGEDFTAELIKTPEGKATLQAAIGRILPLPALVLRRLEVEEQRGLPQVEHQAGAPMTKMRADS